MKKQQIIQELAKRFDLTTVKLVKKTVVGVKIVNNSVYRSYPLMKRMGVK